MGAGRPRKADPGSLYTFAHLFYWDLRRIAEGTSRWRFNEKKYHELTAGVDNMSVIDDDDRVRHQQIVTDEIQAGRLEPTRREERLREIEEGEILARRESYRREATEDSRIYIKVPGEMDVIASLLDPNTSPEQIREVCKDAFMTRTIEVRPGVFEEIGGFPAWPIPPGSTFPSYLSQYAEQWVAALRDRRFPKCDTAARPSTSLKQFWFLSRALAGALFGITTRTAVNLIGSLRPEDTLEASRYAKPERKRKRRKHQLRRRT